MSKPPLRYSTGGVYNITMSVPFDVCAGKLVSQRREYAFDKPRQFRRAVKTWSKLDQSDCVLILWRATPGRLRKPNLRQAVMETLPKETRWEMYPLEWILECAHQFLPRTKRGRFSVCGGSDVKGRKERERKKEKPKEEGKEREMRKKDAMRESEGESEPEERRSGDEGETDRPSGEGANSEGEEREREGKEREGEREKTVNSGKRRRRFLRVLVDGGEMVRVEYVWRGIPPKAYAACDYSPKVRETSEGREFLFRPAEGSPEGDVVGPRWWSLTDATWLGLFGGKVPKEFDPPQGEENEVDSS